MDVYPAVIRLGLNQSATRRITIVNHTESDATIGKPVTSCSCAVPKDLEGRTVSGFGGAEFDVALEAGDSLLQGYVAIPVEWNGRFSEIVVRVIRE